ncbi:MAG: DUF4249 family protein [candidate division WOR-3 bacterium]
MPGKLFLLIFLAFFLFSACELTPDQPFAPQLVVHSLLRSGSHPVHARVNRSYKLNEKYDSIFPLARLKIISQYGEWQFAYAGADSYVTPEPVPVAGGDTWFLVASHPEFDTVRGKTVVPQPYEILFPRSGDTVTVNDSMVWTRSRDAKGYFLSLRQIEDIDTLYLDAIIPNDSFDITYDSLLVRIPKMFFLFFVAPPPDSPPKPCTLWVWALDTNYYTWVLGATGIGGRDSMRLTGGLGVFGSAVERSLPIFVRGDTISQRHPWKEKRSKLVYHLKQ